MELIQLSPLDLAIAGALLLVVALLTWRLRLGMERRMVIAALRAVIQLTILGLVLNILFAQRNPWTIGALSLLMLSAAAFEVMSRQHRRFRGAWSVGIGATSLFVSSFAVTVLALHVVVRVHPWYTPQYSIPLLGMMLGNTMSGVAIGLENLTDRAWRQKYAIEAQLLLGRSWHQAIGEIRRASLRSGLIPIINAMGAAGLVSLPGMMTGQILAGSPPLEAAKYQIMILLLIAVGTSLGTIAAIQLGAKRLFDDRERLRLDRLQDPS